MLIGAAVNIQAETGMEDTEFGHWCSCNVLVRAVCCTFGGYWGKAGGVHVGQWSAASEMLILLTPQRMLQFKMPDKPLLRIEDVLGA
jgi:hypothetical protein